MEVWAAVLSALAQSAGYDRPESEYVFHPTRKWRFDLAWPALRVAFEKEGMAPTGGKSRHTQRDGYADDCDKYNAAGVMGWLVIRATSKQIESGKAADWLMTALALRSGLRDRQPQEEVPGDAH